MPTRPHGLEVETRLPPVSLYLLSMALTPKICSIFCLPPLQTGRVTGHSLGEHEKWCRVPLPHTHQKGINAQYSWKGYRPTAQPPRGPPRPRKVFKVPLCPASMLALITASGQQGPRGTRNLITQSS